MAMHESELQQLILEALPDAEISITHLRDDGDHYMAEIYSNSFKGLTRIQQHQRVYAALKGKMGTDLHALALTTGTLDERPTK
ncbi:MAG: BolA/IbaG family iron-sulfur metabolism protein [Pseudomonadota bacterium]